LQTLSVNDIYSQNTKLFFTQPNRMVITRVSFSSY